MYFSSFVTDDLTSVQLEHCARFPFRSCWIVDSCHAFLDCYRACPQREVVFSALEGGSGGGLEGGQAFPMIKFVKLFGRCY